MLHLLAEKLALILVDHNSGQHILDVQVHACLCLQKAES